MVRKGGIPSLENVPFGVAWELLLLIHWIKGAFIARCVDVDDGDGVGVHARTSFASFASSCEPWGFHVHQEAVVAAQVRGRRRPGDGGAVGSGPIACRGEVHGQRERQRGLPILHVQVRSQSRRSRVSGGGRNAVRGPAGRLAVSGLCGRQVQVHARQHRHCRFRCQSRLRTRNQLHDACTEELAHLGFVGLLLRTFLGRIRLRLKSRRGATKNRVGTSWHLLYVPRVGHGHETTEAKVRHERKSCRRLLLRTRRVALGRKPASSPRAVAPCKETGAGGNAKTCPQAHPRPLCSAPIAHPFHRHPHSVSDHRLRIPFRRHFASPPSLFVWGGSGRWSCLDRRFVRRGGERSERASEPPCPPSPCGALCAPCTTSSAKLERWYVVQERRFLKQIEWFRFQPERASIAAGKPPKGHARSGQNRCSALRKARSGSM